MVVTDISTKLISGSITSRKFGIGLTAAEEMDTMFPSEAPPPPPENRNWRIVRELRRNLTEQEARQFISDPEVYAENDLHEYIERPDGPLTIGRPTPDTRAVL